jgi:hypothetical protein
MSEKAEYFLKGLSEHSKIFELNIEYEYTEEQLILFAEMYHQNQLKLLNIDSVSQQRELFDAILDFTEDLPMCSEDYNRDTLYKRYIAENCG